MEYAGGGDLFDKVEADVGVTEDVAHFYFMQLISGVSFMHSRGVGHRDIKPENILVGETGDLKLADFGLATLFEYNGVRKLSTTFCGSPPYIAPEVISTSRSAGKGKKGYAADLVDIWSCGVVLFVLLVGNTPWDEPTENSYEFKEYMEGRAGQEDDLWSKLPKDVQSLLKGMMCIDPKKRWTFDRVRLHPWFTRKNKLLDDNGKMKDDTVLATEMFQRLKVEDSQRPFQRSSQYASQDPLDLDEDVDRTIGLQDLKTVPSTQPQAIITPISDVFFDWERPSSRHKAKSFNANTSFSSQPVMAGATRPGSRDYMPPPSSLAEEPWMSQFTQNPQVPVSLTQYARRYKDILPPRAFTSFKSNSGLPYLLDLLRPALMQLQLPFVPQYPSKKPSRDGDVAAIIRVKGTDLRTCSMSGDIVIEQLTEFDEEGPEIKLLEVKFLKNKGDPLEWRRFFKKVAVLCREGIYLPGQGAAGISRA